MVYRTNGQRYQLDTLEPITEKQAVQVTSNNFSMRGTIVQVISHDTVLVRFGGREETFIRYFPEQIYRCTIYPERKKKSNRKGGQLHFEMDK